MKNPLNQGFRGFLLPFVGLFAEKEGFEPIILYLDYYI